MVGADASRHRAAYQDVAMTPIRVAVIGIGAMGKGIAYQATIALDIHCAALADRHVDRAVACAEFLQRPYRVARTAAEVCDAFREPALAICEDACLLACCDGIDVVVESSSSIPAGGRHAELGLMHGKHVVMMNAEADLMFGPYLMALAGEHAVTYTSADGDQHGAIMHLVNELRSWGFELVMAGNMKGFLDRYANPTTILPEAVKRNFAPKMTAAFTDGSKVAIEMALVANALGLSAPIPGMAGPRVDHVRNVLGHFDFEAIQRSGPVVDYVLGAQPDGGVFAIGYCDNAYQRSMLSTYKMGAGPFYVFYRPYHLCYVESMFAVREAVKGRPHLQPWCGFRTNVYAYAKKDLQAGERLDGFGGYACYGLIENCARPAVAPGLPIGLADQVTLLRDVGKDERLAWSDVRYDPADPAFAMYARALAAAGSST
jgi:predicted homoserine dehydrogenase-like protein